MKLIGSKTENDYRAELVESHKYHFSIDSKSKLKLALNKSGFCTDRAYILNWTPEQNEDIYLVLIEGQIIVRVETNKIDLSSNPVIEKYDLTKYKTSLCKNKQIQLLVAQELANQ